MVHFISFSSLALKLSFAVNMWISCAASVFMLIETRRYTMRTMSIGIRMHLMVATVIVMWFDVNAQRLRI